MGGRPLGQPMHGLVSLDWDSLAPCGTVDVAKVEEGSRVVFWMNILQTYTESMEIVAD